MKNITNTLLGLALITLSVSCTEPDPAPTTLPEPTGHVTAQGTPDGTAVTAAIGPAGGTIESTDKRIRVEIPVGALTATQTITLQPITNKAPNGQGQAFRLTPHGLQFAKPATISFKYTDEDLNGTFAEALGIAYQDDKGIWKVPKGLTLKKETKTVSVTTTHFSDWSFFESVSLEPSYKALDLGEKTTLAVKHVLKDIIPLVPLTSEDQELELLNPEYLLDAQYIDKWELKGDGDLKATNSTAVYQAPNYIPGQNPVRVEVSIKSKGKAVGLLISRMYVMPEGITLQIDGGDWITLRGGANINSTHNIIEGELAGTFVVLGWVGSPRGQFHWTLGTNVSFVYTVGLKSYQNRYGTEPSLSGGTLNVDDAGNQSPYVLGTFTLTPAGWYQADPYNPMGTAQIRGMFRVKKVN